MNIKATFSIFFISVFLISCDVYLSKQKLVGKWNFSDQNLILNGINDGRSIPMTISTNNSFIRFFEDGSYTAFKAGKYSWGNWEFNEDSLKLKSAEGVDLNCKLQKLEEKKLVLEGENNYSESILNGKFQLTLLKDIYELDEKNEPFTKAKNTWRIRPTHKENFYEIKQRAKNHLEFLIGFHRYALSKKAGRISFNDMVTPFQFINNGIFFHKVDTDDKYYLKWLLTFYDSENATKCRKLLKKTMYKTKLHNEIPDTISYNLDILEQMYKNIDLITEDKLK